jgi:hypothetical protein
MVEAAARSAMNRDDYSGASIIKNRWPEWKPLVGGG